MLGLGKLLGAPITLPIAGMKFIFQQVADLADQELYDEGTLRDQLLLLQVQLEDGDIEEDEFAEREAAVLARLREINARKLALLTEPPTDVPVEAREAPVEVPVEVPVEAQVDARRRLVVETRLDDE
jgi:Gas vesicle protein G